MLLGNIFPTNSSTQALLPCVLKNLSSTTATKMILFHQRNDNKISNGFEQKVRETETDPPSKLKYRAKFPWIGW